MEPCGVGHSLLAALAVVVLVMPYGQPLVCEFTDNATMPAHHQAGAEDTSSSSSDDDGLCHGAMICNTATPGLVSMPSREIAIRTDVVRQDIRSREFLSANTQPPLTPPPRA